MRVVKAWFVRDQDHLARHRYSRDKNTIAIEKLQSKHPTALITIKHLSAIYAMMNVDDEEEDGDSSEWLR